MRITKREHACLDIAHGPSRLIIDPGVFANSLTELSGITVLVITHVHQDHFNEEKVRSILSQNPDLQLFTTRQTADRLSGAKVTVPEIGSQYNVGDFTFEFFGGQHAYIFDELQTPQDQNLGVLVNDRLYYPGDSFAPCPKAHTAVAVPANAPWMKLEEARIFLEQDPSRIAFPTHNGFVNEAGNNLVNTLLAGCTEQSGKEYKALETGDTFEI